MQFTVERSSPRGDREVLHVHGELDVATAPTLAASVDGVLASSPASLVLDLTGTTFLDSTGSRQLARTARLGAEAGAQVLLVCPPANRAVRRVVDFLDLAALLPVLDEAPSG